MFIVTTMVLGFKYYLQIDRDHDAVLNGLEDNAEPYSNLEVAMDAVRVYQHRFATELTAEKRARKLTIA